MQPAAPSLLSNAKTKAERSPPRSNGSHSPAHAAPRPITRASPDHTTHGESSRPSRETTARAATTSRSDAYERCATVRRRFLSSALGGAARPHWPGYLEATRASPHQKRRSTSIFQDRVLRPAARPEGHPRNATSRPTRSSSSPSTIIQNRTSPSTPQPLLGGDMGVPAIRPGPSRGCARACRS